MDSLFEAAGALIPDYAAVPWAQTPLGSPDRWSQPLRGAVDLVLNARVPGCLYWGAELTMIYNEAYLPLIGAKHPALGVPAQQVFPEIWSDIGPLLTDVLSGAPATWIEDMRFLLSRRGFAEECFFSFSYSPVHGLAEQGRMQTVEGVVNVVSETSTQVRGRRRLEQLADLTRALSDSDGIDQVVKQAAAALRTDDLDFAAVKVRQPGDAERHLDGDPVWAGRHVRATRSGHLVELRLDAPPAPYLLGLSLSEHIAVDTDCLGFVGLIAGALDQALERDAVRRAERQLADAEREMSETLQRSMLTDPVQPDHLEVAVRYQPAAEQAQIGGDWYDAFLTPDGSLMLVVGDVTGHDQYAAAAMGQLRNLLRGVAFTAEQPPGGVLASLDAAMHGVAPSILATGILAQIEQTQLAAARGERVLRWSNAGHPPPALLDPDGSVRLLEDGADVMLGIDPDLARHDHTVTIAPGASIVFYTDGLIERRGAGLDDGLAVLVETLTGRQRLTGEQLCDHLLDQLGARHEDDIVLLVVHAYPDEGPRPPEAGPTVLPEDL